MKYCIVRNILLKMFVLSVKVGFITLRKVEFVWGLKDLNRIVRFFCRNSNQDKIPSHSIYTECSIYIDYNIWFHLQNLIEYQEESPKRENQDHSKNLDFPIKDKVLNTKFQQLITNAFYMHLYPKNTPHNYYHNSPSLYKRHFPRKIQLDIFCRFYFP